MEITELTLLAARAIIIILMYLFVMILVLALRADSRALRTSQYQVPLSPRTPMRGRDHIPTPTAAPAVPITLTVTAGTPPTTGQEYRLVGPLDIGRSATSAVCIPNNFVSTHHARITRQHGRWVVEDLHSTNGTLVNGNAVTSAQPLAPGDLLTIGDTVFRVG